MGSYPFLDIIFLLFLTLYILNKYGNWRRQRVAVTLATLIAWYFSIVIIAILPLDVSMTTYYQCLANVNSSSNLTIAIPYNVTTQSYKDKIYVEAYYNTNSPISHTYKHSRKRILSIKREIDDVSPEIPPSNLLIDQNKTITKLNYVNESTREIGKNLTLPLNLIKPITLSEGKNQSEPLHIVCEKPWNNIPRSVLPSLWRVVYWTSQILTWLILPLMQTYSKAGDFTVFSKIKTAIYENLLWYGSYVLIFIVLMVYVAFKPNLHFDMSKLLTICSSASNTWGLTLLVLLLGYGLIEVPRSLWRYSFMSGRVKLDRCFYKAALLFPKKAEAEENLEEVLEDVKQLVATVPTHHASRPKVDILIDKIPESYRSKLNLRSASEVADEESRLHRALDIPPNQKAMVKLNKRLIASLTAHYRTQMQWEALMDSIIGLEKDLRHISTRRQKPANPSSRRDAPEVESGQANDGGDNRDLAYLIQSLGNGRNPENDLTEMSHKGGRWEIALHLTRRRLKIMGIYFRRYVRPYSYRLLAIIFGFLSIAVIWSELVLFKRNPALSLFAIFFRLAKEHRHNYIYLQTVSILTITYLSVCAYFPIFKLRLFDFYALIPHHHTDENSLLFSGLLLSRLTSPLCLNFLCLIHMDRYVSLKSGSPGSNSRIYETTFIQVMGRMEFLPIIAHGFNVYFPMAIALLCLANYFDLLRKALRAVGYSRATASDFNEYYVNAKAGADHQSDGHADVLTLVEEGKQLVRRELRNRILKSRESQGGNGPSPESRYGGLKVRSADSITSRNNVHERARPLPEAMKDARLASHSSREDLLPKQQRYPTDFGSGPVVGKYRAMLGQAVAKAGQVTNYRAIKSRVENTLNNGLFSKTSSAPAFAPRLDSDREPITNYGTGSGFGNNLHTPIAPTNLFDDI